jgi:hypothetical protein
MSNDFTPAALRMFASACALFGLSDAARDEFAGRIRVLETEDRDGRRALQVSLSPVANAKDLHTEILVARDWKGRWTASLVEIHHPTRPELTERVLREIPGTEGATARTALVALWAFYAHRLANGCAEVRPTFR